MLKPVIIIFAVVIITASLAAAGPLNLNVVYPKPDQFIGAVDSNFIFGSVEPKSSLSINGQPVEVHKKGGWLAFVDVQPGEFEFFIRAEKKGVVDTMTLKINLPELPQPDYDSLYFTPGSFRPAGPMWVTPGDVVDVSFSGTPYCNAFCVVANTGDTIPMKELPPQHYYRGRNVFDERGGRLEDADDSLLIRGIYTGSFKVPENAPESLQFVYNLYPPSFMQMTWLIRYSSELKKKPLEIHDLGSLDSIKSYASTFPVIVLQDKTPTVMELTDSLTTIRTGPRKGYLCIHQPAGIRAVLAGKEGPWIKLKLSDYQYGWVPDTACIKLPPATPIPHSYISRVGTVNHQDKVSVVLSTSARHPFRVEENIDENSITLLVYGADSDTDWIRYDNSDSLIDHIVWFEPEPGMYGLKIYLTEDQIWGYDGHYVDDDLHLDLKKFPEDKKDIYAFRFVIDPGHSPDPGAVGPTGLTEKEANLDIALRLKKDLEREGAEVILTRYDHSELPLYDRPKIAVSEKAEIFISVHNNALPNGTNPFVNNGVSTYYYHPHSARLARAVQNSFSRNLKLNDFGWYYGNFAVNRPTQYPAILVECAFMMIPEQEEMLRKGKFRKKISAAIVEGIKDFLRGHSLSDWDTQQKTSYGR